MVVRFVCWNTIILKTSTGLTRSCQSTRALLTLDRWSDNIVEKLLYFSCTSFVVFFHYIVYQRIQGIRYGQVCIYFKVWQTTGILQENAVFLSQKVFFLNRLLFFTEKKDFTFKKYAFLLQNLNFFSKFLLKKLNCHYSFLDNLNVLGSWIPCFWNWTAH